jgi:choline dehydrogenase
VVAARLSEDPDVSVCLIEAGGSDASAAITIPMLSFIANSRPAFAWGYQTEGIEALDGRRIGLTQAKVLGGASAINGTLYQRSHSSEYDGWGVRSWSFDALLPHFKRSETYLGRPSPYRGTEGPIQVQRSETNLPIAHAFLNAAQAAGHPLVDDTNANVAHGFGFVDCTIAGGRRETSYRAFIRPARVRPNLTVLSGAEARRIAIVSGRATAVELVRTGVVETVTADREIIVAAGAIGSPKLLMLSGIGNADHLTRCGIPVKADRAAVGTNLANHVRYSLLYVASEAVTAYRYRTLAGAIPGGIDYILRRRGFLAGTALPVGGVASTDGDSSTPDINIALSTALMGSGRGALGVMPKQHGFSLLVRQGRPFSRGSVRLRSGDPSAAPIIDTRYLSDSRDLAVLMRGIRLAREIVSQPELRKLVKREIQPGPIVDDPEALAASIRSTAGHVFHPVGTCRIGEDADSVLDPQLRVRGVEGLRVADTSAIPALVTSGTYALALMIGERAADVIRQGR